MTSDGWLMTEQAGVETPTLTMMQEQQITQDPMKSISQTWTKT